MFNITFNGVNMPSFLSVRTVDTAVLPSISHAFRPIAGGRGLREIGTSVGGRLIKFNIAIIPVAGYTVLQMNRELAHWLRGNNFKLSTLVISDEPNMSYQAKVNDICDINDLLYVGEGTLEFIVPYGFAKSTATVPITIDNTARIIAINYNGTASSYPILTWTPQILMSNWTLEFTNLESGDLFSLTGDFHSGETITIDFLNKVVKRAGVVEMKLINLSSDWLNIAGRGNYTIAWNLAGNCTCTTDENWL